MSKKVKIYLAIFLLLFSFNAKAVLPLIWAGISAVNTAAGTLSAVEVGVLLAGSAAALYGTQMGYIQLKKDNDSGSVRIPLTNLPRDRPTVDLPANTPTTYTPPTFKCPESPGAMAPAVHQCYVTVQTTTYSLRGNYCDVVNKVEFSLLSPLPSGCSSNLPATSYSYSGFPATSLTQAEQTCGEGYTKNASNQCVLSEPQKIPDKNCDLQVSTNSSGGSLIKSNTDPDCASSPVNVSPAGVANVPVMLPDPETGQPKEHHISVFPDGAGSNCYYQVCIPVAGLPGHYQIGVSSTGVGNTTKYQVISVDADGVVDGVRSGTMAGTIATTGTYVDANGNTQTIAPGQAVLVQVGSTGQVVQAVPAAQTQVTNLPSDYARTGEASAAADKIVNKLAETDNMSDLAAPEITNPLIQYFNPLYAWAPNVVAGTCPTGSFSWNNHTYGFNEFCTLFEQYAPAIQSVMLVVSVVFSLFIVLGA